MSYRLIVTEKARGQLVDIASYIAEESGDVDIALGVIEHMERAVKQLCDMPHRGSIPRDATLRKLGHRVLIVEPYLIFYRCDDRKQTATITAIVHSRRDYTNLL